MSRWQISGQYMETCNCALLCPCITSNLAARPTEGDCKAAVAMRIDKGSKDGVKLDGLAFIVMLHSPGAMGDGTTDQLLFAADPTPYLSSFNFTGYEPGGYAVLLPSGFYEVTPDFTPVPEMNPTVAAALVCLFGLLAMKKSRRELGRLIFWRQRNNS